MLCIQLKNVQKFKFEDYTIMTFFFLSGNIPKAVRMKNFYIKPINRRMIGLKNHQKYVVTEQTKL